MAEEERASSTSPAPDDVPFDTRASRDVASAAVGAIFFVEALRSRGASPVPSSSSYSSEIFSSEGGAGEGRKRRGTSVQVALQQVHP